MSEEIEIELTDDEAEAVKYIWEEIISKRTREKTLKTIGWKTIEDFASDIFRHGMNKASEEPIAFIKNRILGEFPVLKEDIKEEEVKGDFKKLYG